MLAYLCPASFAAWTDPIHRRRTSPPSVSCPSGQRRLRARQLERQLFQQRLAGASLELSLRTYNKCLGEVEEELQDAAAEIQVPPIATACPPVQLAAGLQYSRGPADPTCMHTEPSFHVFTAGEGGSSPLLGAAVGAAAWSTPL